MPDAVLLVEHLDDAVTLLTLNRPQRRNALSIELMESLCNEFASVAADPRRRVVILRGAGPAFCAGMDLYEAADASVAEQSAQCVARLFETVTKSSLATIAAAHGAALAGGGGLLACCDLAVASEELQIGFPEVRRGLIPALVAAYLQSRLRDGELRELMLLGEPIAAERAREMGLVQRIVPADRLLDEAKSLAAQIAAGAPQAVRETKRLLLDLRRTPVNQGASLALDFHQQARGGNEAAEGLAAFLERRAPQWPS
jgi:methylglutaconyl-CoA hydratase